MSTAHLTRRRRRAAGLGAAAAVALAGLALAGTGPARAGEVHTIQTADSPSTGAPILGGGSWLVNKPSGYYVGRAMAGSAFDDEVTTSGNWHYGRAISTVNMCGWVLPGSMGADRGPRADDCSTATQDALSHRRTVGRDFNAPAHATGDGTAAPANTGCQLYYNYFYGTDFTGNGGHWADPAAGATSGTVMYRFTTNDGAAVVVRDPALGWGFLPIGCVTRPAARYNDND